MRRLSIWRQKEIDCTIGCLHWRIGLNIGEGNLESCKDVVIMGHVVTKRNCQSCRRNMQNVLQDPLFFTVNGILNIISDSLYCCEAHIWSPIEDRRECLYYLEIFLAFVNNKIVEEYFYLFQFNIGEGNLESSRDAVSMWHVNIELNLNGWKGGM